MDITIDKEKKDQQLFDDIAKNYFQKDVVQSCVYARQYKVFKAVSPILSHYKNIEVMLDIACGVGSPAEYFKNYYKHYIGIDYSDKLIEAAKKYNYNNKKVQFISCNIKDVIKNGFLQKNTADIILAIGALHHMTDLNVVMGVLRDLAKVDSYFVAIEPNNANPIIQIMRWFRSKIDPSYSSDQKFFSKNELRDLLKANKFKYIELEFQGFFSPPFAEIKIYPQIISVPLSRAAVWLDKKLDKYLPEYLKFLSWNIIIRAQF